MQFIIAITVLVATLLGSISGIGGGVLIKPVMDAICDMTSSQISFLSGTTVLTMTIVSLLRSRKDPVKIDRRGTFLAVGAAFGGLAGKSIFDLLVQRASSSAGVSLVQNIIMVILTVAVFFYILFKARIRQKNLSNPVVCVVCGLFLGVMSSFLGIGGGPINIMLLSYFFAMETKTAALNSLYVIFFSQSVSLVSNIVTGSVPQFGWWILGMMMVCAVVGATIGRKLSSKMTDRHVDILFMGLLFVIIGISIYNCFRFALMV
ncbi:MAG: sulfite exporter TauE/SafE family protein [Sphaerochaetaceae bacterium]|nr:sulfite exporter TauE/SafE family protein [Sphaerochaetaceae bacterium]